MCFPFFNFIIVGLSGILLYTSGPSRFDGERRFGGDRDGYRGGPRGPGVEFGDKGGAPADYRPTYGVTSI